MTALYQQSASNLAALIRTREVSSREVIQAHLDRIEEVNGAVNAVTVVLRESALAAADEADRSSPAGPLHGVPFTIKESIDCLGSATTFGVPALEHSLPYLDAPSVARLKAAGAIPLARTNMSEMGMRFCTDNPLRGRTINPWNARRTVGGSSGGDAAALAVGMTPLGLANDMGGSLRYPAYCCGIASLKPTVGRIPRASSLEPRDFGMAGQLMFVEGPMARSVADLRLALRALAGRDIRDPRSVDAPLEGPAAPRRAALVMRVPGVDLPAATIQAIKRAGELLAAAGWIVEHAIPPELQRVNEVWGEVFATDFTDQVLNMRPILSGSLYSYLTRLCESVDIQDLPNHVVHAERSRLTRAWSHFFSSHSVTIGPTWTRLPWALDEDLDPDRGIDMLREVTRFVTPASILGLPALSMPMGVVDGLPTGIQIHADLWREDLCLAAADVIEAGVDMQTPIEPVR